MQEKPKNTIANDDKSDEHLDIEALYRRITSIESRKAVGGLFSATPEELAKASLIGKNHSR